MMTFSWLLLALGFVGAIIYVVWDYRKKRAARAAASSERFTRIFAAAAQGAADPGDGAEKAARAMPPAQAATASVPSAPAFYARRTAFLDARHGQLWTLLRAGLPDHAVFAHVSLAAVLELTGVPEGREREQRLRGLAQQSLDCVVCNRAFDVIAAIDLENGATADARFKVEALKAARVRYLRWSPLELPAVADIAPLLVGGGESAEARPASRDGG